MGGITRLAISTVAVSTSYTRPSDTTQYGAGDALSDSTSAPTALTFAGVGRGTGSAKGGTGVILGAVCLDSIVTASQSLELHLFSAIPTATNDNSALSYSDAQAAFLVAVFPFTTWFVTALNQFSHSSGVEKPFVCAIGDSALYGLVAVRGTPTPASAEIVTFTLFVRQD